MELCSTKRTDSLIVDSHITNHIISNQLTATRFFGLLFVLLLSDLTIRLGIFPIIHQCSLSGSLLLRFLMLNWLLSVDFAFRNCFQGLEGVITLFNLFHFFFLFFLLIFFFLFFLFSFRCSFVLHRNLFFLNFNRGHFLRIHARSSTLECLYLFLLLLFKLILLLFTFPLELRFLLLFELRLLRFRRRC